MKPYFRFQEDLMPRVLICVSLTFLLAACGGGQRENATSETPSVSVASTDAVQTETVRSKSTGAVNASEFWTRFRSAVVEDDIGVSMEMVRFPIEVRGQLDDAPSRQLSKEEFRPMFAKLLNQDTGLQQETQSMRDLIQSTSPEHFSESIEDSRFVRLGAFQFELTESGWLLTRVYVDD